MQIIILDTETTGLNKEDRLIQLAYKNTTTGEEVNEYFKPAVPISFGAMATHHITEEMVATKPVFIGSKYQTNLIKTLKDNILVAHNALFDINILKNEGVETGKYIDTLKISKHLIDSQRYDLQYLRYSLNLDSRAAVAHNALGDIMILEKLFEHLKGLVKTKLNLEAEEQILEIMMKLSSTPVLLEQISFGKYKGKDFAEINQIDSAYLEWLYNSESSKDPSEQKEDLIYTLKNHLGLRGS